MKTKIIDFFKRMWEYIKRIKKYPILCHILIIVCVIGALVGISHLAMSLGTRHNSRCTVPNFEGVLLSEARRTADKNDLEIVVNDSLYVASYPGGTILDQLPNGGVVVKPGRKIYVTINAYSQRMVTVPYVAGRSLRQAVNMLEAAGLGVKRIEYVEDLATNYVLEQYLNDEMITEGSELKAQYGSGIILKVGIAADAKPLAVPLLLDCSLAEAKSRLWEAGLNVGETYFDDGILAIDRDNAKVYSQSVTAGRTIPYGRRISLYLSLDEAKAATAKEEHEKAVQRERELADSLANVEQALRRQAEENQASQTIQDNFFL